jgi:predicted RNA-binding protein with PIN domain
MRLLEKSIEKGGVDVSCDILVDGYNVIKRGESFQAARKQSLAAARAQLIALLVNRYRHTPHQVTIVFDGDTAVERVSYERGIRIIYSRHGETADCVLDRLSEEAHQAGREVMMFSDDNEVRGAASQRGGTALSAQQLERQMYAAPRGLEWRARHHLAVRRKYGLDPWEMDKDDDDHEPPRRPGKKKKRR